MKKPKECAAPVNTREGLHSKSFIIAGLDSLLGQVSFLLGFCLCPDK